MQTGGGWVPVELGFGLTKSGRADAELVWRVKLVAELQAGVTTETEVARIERGEEAGLADLGLRLDEAKQLTATLQAEMIAAQLAVVGERRRGCATCGRPLASKATTQRSGDLLGYLDRNRDALVPYAARRRRESRSRPRSSRARSTRSWPNA